MDFDVIITCSGTGSRLARLTTYLNKALIKIGDCAAISHIINSYPKNIRFIITLGYLSQQVKDYLHIAHPHTIIEYVEIDCYEGEGSSLLYSLSKTFPFINKPFYFNACDTIVKNINFNLKNNTAYAASPLINNQYRFYGEKIENRSAELHEDCYIGLSYIKDFELFKDIANNLLHNYDTQLSDAHVLPYLNIDKKNISQDDWTDIGNYIALSLAEKKYTTSIITIPKINQSTYLYNNKIIKFFNDITKVNQLYERAIELSDCAPVVYKKNNFLYYDFVPGSSLADILDEQKLINFLNWCQDYLWINKKNDNQLDFYQSFYQEKTTQRVYQYLQHFTQSQDIRNINLLPVQNIFDLLLICKNVNQIQEKCIFCRTHGDLVFDNVISNSSYVLIDWREGFNGFSGDLYYDLAKMKHNLIFNHNTINLNNFTVIEKECSALFDANITPRNNYLLNIFDQWCNNHLYDIDVINVKMAFIQLSSSGLHLKDDAKLLFYMGWYNLQLNINKYLKN